MQGFKFYSYKSIKSTNEKALELAKKKVGKAIVTAEKQTHGRGRFKRNWLSPKGGLYMTILLREDDLDNPGHLTFAAALSIVKVLKKFGIKSQVKWPNDVLIDGKKVCGILTETLSGKENYAAVGIGINVNQKKFLGKSKHQPTSMHIETKKFYDVEGIAAKVAEEFKKLHRHYERKEFGKIISLWKKNSHTLGKKVKVKTLKGIIRGKAVDVDENCNLIVEAKGKEKIIPEGDIFLA